MCNEWLHVMNCFSDVVRVTEPLVEHTVHTDQLRIAFRIFVGRFERK